MSDKGLNLKFIESKILKCPRELDGLYEDLIKKIEDTELLEAGKLFQWICFEARPLLLDELRTATAVHLSGTKRSLAEYENKSNPNYITNGRKMKKRMIYLSRGLVGIADPRPAEGSSLVGFYHETIKSFMLTKGLRYLNGRLVKAQSLAETAHFKLANTCIDYLSTEEICAAFSEGRMHFPTQFFFLEYAATNWLAHAVEAEGASYGEHVTWPSQSTLDTWVSICRSSGANPTRCPEEGTSFMHIAAEHGLERLAERIYIRTSQEIPASTATKPISRQTINSKTKIPVKINPVADRRLNKEVAPNSVMKNQQRSQKASSTKQKSHGLDENHIYGSMQQRTRPVEEPQKRKKQGSKMQFAGAIPKDQRSISNAKNKAEESPLHLAARCGHIGMTRLLHGHDSEVAIINQDGCTTLYMAAETGHREVVKFLYEHGADADIHTPANDGSTPLYSASFNGHMEVVQLLLENRPEVTVATNEGSTPLHAASYHGHIEIGKLLLEKGANITITNNHGWTPLHGAAFKGWNRNRNRGTAANTGASC